MTSDAVARPLGPRPSSSARSSFPSLPLSPRRAAPGSHARRLVRLVPVPLSLQASACAVLPARSTAHAPRRLRLRGFVLRPAAAPERGPVRPARGPHAARDGASRARQGEQLLVPVRREAVRSSNFSSSSRRFLLLSRSPACPHARCSDRHVARSPPHSRSLRRCVPSLVAVEPGSQLTSSSSSPADSRIRALARAQRARSPPVGRHGRSRHRVDRHQGPGHVCDRVPAGLQLFPPLNGSCASLPLPPASLEQARASF